MSWCGKLDNWDTIPRAILLLYSLCQADDLFTAAGSDLHFPFPIGWGHLWSQNHKNSGNRPNEASSQVHLLWFMRISWVFYCCHQCQQKRIKYLQNIHNPVSFHHLGTKCLAALGDQICLLDKTPYYRSRIVWSFGKRTTTSRNLELLLF